MANGSQKIEKILESQMVKAARLIEERLDNEIERLDNIKDDELEQLRERRLRQLKDQARMKDEWLSKGHGHFKEVSERQFFDECRSSSRLVCHFYRDSTFRCGIVDRHLKQLAPRHLECKFVRICVERAPFLTRRLGVRVLPTVCIVKDEKICDYIVGFDDLGGRDDFSTEMLEWRLGKAGAIDYKGDLKRPPDTAKQQQQQQQAGKRKTVRGDGQNRSDTDDDDDW